MIKYVKNLKLCDIECIENEVITRKNFDDKLGSIFEFLKKNLINEEVNRRKTYLFFIIL